MKKWMKILITIIVIIVLVIILYYITKTVSAVTGKGIAGWVSKFFK